MKYPALDVRDADSEFVLALVDDYAPSAVEDVDDGVCVYFATAERRDQAQAAVAAAMPDARLSTRDVDDEDWAKRSQQNLTPITVGRITITPPWFVGTAAPATTGEPGTGPNPVLHPPSSALQVVILPSMGFGTGHHATTRLCLAATQAVDVAGRQVLDVGTGSGVLALAAAALGSGDVLGIDFDPDAITNADENLELNPGLSGVRFQVVDVKDAALPSSDIVFANLTGAVLIQNAVQLRSAVAPGGTLIVSGLQTHEREDVVEAFSPATIRWTADELDWVAIAFTFPGMGTV